MIGGMGPQNKTHAQVSHGLTSGHHFLAAYVQALLANSLVFGSGTGLLYRVVLFTAIADLQVLRATYRGISRRNVQNIQKQNIIGFTIYFFTYTLPLL